MNNEQKLENPQNEEVLDSIDNRLAGLRIEISNLVKLVLKQGVEIALANECIAKLKNNIVHLEEQQRKQFVECRTNAAFIRVLVREELQIGLTPQYPEIPGGGNLLDDLYKRTPLTIEKLRMQNQRLAASNKRLKESMK